MAVKGSATVTLSQYRDTESVTRYYKLQSSSLAAPDKPTNVKPNETPAGWSKSEPACDITKTMYTCDVTVFSDKTTHVSDVSKSTSYEAAKEAWNKANNAQGTADKAQSSAGTAQNTANKAQGTADKAQSSADKAQNTATEAAKTANNYISTDATGIMVSENKGATKETPSNATKNNVLITEKDVQIRNGKKVVASYGDSIRLGEAASQHISVDNAGLAIQDGDKKQFEVRTLTDGRTFTDVWLDEGRISPDSGLDTSRVFFAAEIDSVLDSTYYDEEILNLTFPSQGVPKVTLIFGGGNSGYNVPTGSSNAIYFTAADQDIEGKALKLVIDYRDNPSGVSGGFNWSDLSAIKVEYTINFTPTTVRIGDGATEDTFINDGTPVNSFKALKVGKGMSREGNWQKDNAFDVDFNGNTYVGGELAVNQDILNQGGQIYTGTITAVSDVYARNVYSERPDGTMLSIVDLIYPVGSIYMSVNSANPETLFGGTWQQIKDRFLLSAGDTYAAGKTGGSADAVVVKHLHQPSTGDGFNAYMSGAGERVRVGTSTASNARYTIVGKKNASSADASGLRFAGSTDWTGSDGAGKNMPPYLAVYVWQRIS